MNPTATTRGTLSDAEAENVRRAIRFLRRRLTAKGLAEKIGSTGSAVRSLTAPTRRPSVRVAFVVARVAKVPVEDVLSGAWPPAGACPHCGRGA